MTDPTNESHNQNGEFDALIRTLQDQSDVAARAEAVAALGRLGDQRAVQPLIASLQNDSDPYVRAQAARALGFLGDPAAKAALLEALQTDTLEVGAEAGTALGRVSAAQATGRPVVPVSAPAKPERHIIRKGFLWQAAFWIGILMLIMGCLIAGIVLYSLVSFPADPVEWPVIFGCTGAAFILGGLLVFLATRPPRT